MSKQLSRTTVSFSLEELTTIDRVIEIMGKSQGIELSRAKAIKMVCRYWLRGQEDARALQAISLTA